MKVSEKCWRGKNEGWEESQRVSFMRGGRYYEHIYPKLENNEERLKPSQYFRCSKWTTSPVVDNGPQRVPDTIMCLKWESDNVKASLQDRGKETWIRSTCAHPLLYILSSGDKTRGNAHCLKWSKKCKEAFTLPILAVLYPLRVQQLDPG